MGWLHGMDVKEWNPTFQSEQQTLPRGGMDVSVNEMLESTRQYFQGVPVGGQATTSVAAPPPAAAPLQPLALQGNPPPHTAPASSPYWPPSQYTSPPAHYVRDPSPHRIPTLAPFSSIAYRSGGGGVLPGVTQVKNGSNSRAEYNGLPASYDFCRQVSPQPQQARAYPVPQLPVQKFQTPSTPTSHSYPASYPPNNSYAPSNSFSPGPGSCPPSASTHLPPSYGGASYSSSATTPTTSSTSSSPFPPTPSYTPVSYPASYNPNYPSQSYSTPNPFPPTSAPYPASPVRPPSTPTRQDLRVNHPDHQQLGPTPPPPPKSREFPQQHTFFSSSVPLLATNTPTTTTAMSMRPSQPSTSAVNNSLSVIKRESPLDLSVKTVRQSADSTARDDSEQMYNTFMFSNDMRLKTPPQGPGRSPAPGLPLRSEYDPSRHNTQQPTTAPKVEFVPSFNVNLNPSYQQDIKSRSKKPEVSQYQAFPNVLPSMATFSKTHSAYDYHNHNSYSPANSNSMPRPSSNFTSPNGHIGPGYIDQKKEAKYSVQPSVPRVPNSHDMNYHLGKRPMPTEPKHTPPAKLPKIDTWRQTIDQQIESRISSYLSSKGVVNGDINPSKILPNYSNNHLAKGQHVPFSQPSSSLQYPGNNSQYFNHASPTPLKIPSAVTNGAADKRVLSILRNSLETKEARNIQMQQQAQQQQLQQQQLQQQLLQHQQHLHSHPHHQSLSQQHSLQVHQMNSHLHQVNQVPLIQQQSMQTKVVQPVPRSYPTGVIEHNPHLMSDRQHPQFQPSRHNLPLTPLNLERSTSIPYTKLNIPKAIDSMQQDNKFKPVHDSASMTEEHDMKTFEEMSKGNGHGLASFLASQSRMSKTKTKAELKQPMAVNADGTKETTNAKVVSPHPAPGFMSPSPDLPPKDMTRIEGSCIKPPWSMNLHKAPKENSSSSGSGQQRRDSDSEGEMPILERQSFTEMRKDRRHPLLHHKQPLAHSAAPPKDPPLPPPPPPQPPVPETEEEKAWFATCDQLLEQLKEVGPELRKKWRRKKDSLEPGEKGPDGTPIKSEPSESCDTSVVSEDDRDNLEVKLEMEDEEEFEEFGEEEEGEEKPNVSDIDRLLLPKEEATAVSEERTKGETDSLKSVSSGDESDINSDVGYSEDESECRDLNEPSNHRTQSTSAEPSPKKLKILLKASQELKEGTVFSPGWEEEFYKYKKSLRMPPRLICIPRPFGRHKGTSSLPDLDFPSSPFTTDSLDAFSNKSKMDFEMDPDLNKKTDEDEVAKNIKEEKVSSPSKTKGKDTKKAGKTKTNDGAKTKGVSKSNYDLELLPTPSLDMKLTKGKKGIEASCDIKNSSYLGFFRKETVSEYRDVFERHRGVRGHHDLPPVMPSRTRTETRVMKEKVTMKEVFGVERPASAPPAGFRMVLNEDGKFMKKHRGSSALLRGHSKRLTAKLRKRNRDLLDNFIAAKKLKKKIQRKKEPSIPPTDKPKGKSIRRKLKSSGFDYIKKKKKVTQKKDGNDTVKEKKSPSKAAPSTEEEIEAEIKGWTLNKSLGETMLHRAAKLGYTAVVKYCLEKLKHSPCSKDNVGYTPLHEACTRGHFQITKLLLSAGANASESAKGGIRPLHEAAEHGYKDIVKVLLKHGADPLVATYSGSTALSLACDKDTKSVLQQHLANRTVPKVKIDLRKGGKKEGDKLLPVEVKPKAKYIDGFEIEESMMLLPNLYRLSDEDRSESFFLFHEVAPLLKVKTKEGLLRQLGDEDSQNAVRDLKMSEFKNKATCRAIKPPGNKDTDSPFPVKVPKVTMVRYTDRIKFLLGVEVSIIPR